MGMGKESVFSWPRSEGLQTPVPLTYSTFLGSTNFSPTPTQGLTPAQHQGGPSPPRQAGWGGGQGEMEG